MDNLKIYQKPSKPANPKTVLVFGTFDILHPGHLNFFEQAKKAGGEGSRLVVVVARDFNSKQAKGIFPINNESSRLDAVKKANAADEVILGELNNKFEIIKKIRPDIICIGYDQKIPEGFSEWIKKHNFRPEIITLRPYNPEKFKSSKFR